MDILLACIFVGIIGAISVRLYHWFDKLLNEKVFSDHDDNKYKNNPVEAAYVASVVESITEQIASLREKLEADKVEVESTAVVGIEVKGDNLEKKRECGKKRI